MRERLDATAKLFDHARCEGFLNEGPQPRVIWRVEIEHIARQRTEEPRDPRLPRGLFPRERVRLVFCEAFVPE